ncbi:tRNA lysidine(34) synthetase TilS [Sphingopyxis sp. BSNA05]|uniref:tRNA lysidine(34) synthetase TilS n=1 Tax=Sphingopyxis sp. BSNA05 TaxID=1236614 RepID=UPI00156531B6|nr:tRNA lysidine(34) synthetase TilS [Sphingopyxis sp. BSNA05]NRD90442.1 tRNA lysidine(34) synthetase TilS [Sphingopyxis sp. BSNA05]
MTGTAASLESRFSEALDRLLPAFASSEQKLGLAVSGGPDSLALLLLALQAYPDRIAAATVDHGLRPAGREEAEFVASICRERGIPHDILRPVIPIRGSIQSAARHARYGLLHDWMKDRNIDWLATAHHADDQLETMIMRILRGSGIDGMSGIREKRTHIIRPLLHFQKSELVSHVAGHGLNPVDDPSNRDQGFDRVRVRNALQDLEGFDTSLASQSASALGDAREAIEWMVERLAEDHLKPTDLGCTLSRTRFPHEIQRRLLLRCLHSCDPALSPRGSQIDQTIIALEKGETVTLGDILCRGGAVWRFQPAPERRTS